MADRLPQYPMLPANFNSSLLQQQQISQSQGDPQSLTGFPNSENNRVWQNQYRSQQGGNPSGSQQMPDMLRNQSMPRVQGQQQMGQQFGLAPQMGTQQPSFHDQATQQSQSHIPPNFTNMPIQNASQIQQQLNSRNVMLQAFQANNQGHMRQLEMMSLAQNQQSQNGPVGYSARMVQQQQHQANMNSSSGQNQSSQSDLFSSPSMSSPEGLRRSPSHLSSQPAGPIGNQQAPMPQNSQAPPAGRRPMTFQELRDRAQQIQTYITHHEQLAMQLSNQRAGASDAEFISKMRGLTNEIKNRKEMLSKVIQAMGNSAPQLSGQSPGNVHSMNGSPLQPHQQPNSIQNGQNPSSWMSQPGPPQAQGLAGPQMGGQGPSHGQSQSHNIQLQLQSQANQSQQQQNLVPPRSGPTPQQHLPGHLSPNMANQFPFMNGGQGPQPRPEQNLQSAFMPMPPLDKERFESAYSNYCNSKGITHDNRLMSVDNRLIDLHSLHSHVMAEGGGIKVNQKELWSVIGGRMGFVQFPNTDTEPAKSGPGVAQHLAHVYKKYLSTFDSVYVHSVVESKRKLQATAAVRQAQAALNMAAGANASRTLPVTNAQQMQMIVAYANIPTAELRARGVPDRVIHFVDQNRGNLQLSSQQQQAFRGMVLKPNQAPPPGQPSEADRMPPSNGGGQFLSQQNSSLPSALPNSSARSQHFNAPNHMSSMVNGNNFGSTNMDPQFLRQAPQPAPQGTPNGGPAPPNRPRPNHEQLQYAATFIGRVKQDFNTRNIPNMPLQVVPDDQRAEFNTMIEQLYRFTQDLETKLPMYYVMLKQEDVIGKLIAIMVTVQQQRGLLSSGTTPKYIVDLNMLHMMNAQIQQANDLFTNILQTMMAKQQPPNTGSLPNGHPGAGIPQPRPSIPRPPSQAPPPPQQPIPPPLPNRSVSLAQPPPPKKKAPPIQPGPSNSASSATISTPATPPAPSASTPVANAPTPTQAASSPQGAKSPKSKPAPKPKTVGPTKRKVSKNTPATPELVAPPTPSSTGSGSKRAREQETTASGAGPSSEPSSPKRVKTEWEGHPREALVSEQEESKQEEDDNIKTEEDASVFFERMTELIKLAGGQGESLTLDIAENLDMILKGCGAVPDAPEGSSMSLGLGESLHESSPPPKPPADEFVEFFDFSSFGTLDDDDPGSKALTPDLVSSSSTNPSPESGSEVDTSGHPAVDVKTEDLDPSDPLRLGQWKEIDGGESAYYQPDHWKWDSPMPTLEPPWAIFTT